MLAYLIHEGADTSALCKNGNSLMSMAVYAKNKPAVQLLLNAGETLNLADPYGNTPLWSAIKNDDVEMMLFLIENGADVYWENNNHETPFIQAVKNQKTKCFHALINGGYNAHLINSEGLSAQYFALQAHIKAASMKEKHPELYEKAREIVNTLMHIPLQKGAGRFLPVNTQRAKAYMRD